MIHGRGRKGLAIAALLFGGGAMALLIVIATRRMVFSVGCPGLYFQAQREFHDQPITVLFIAGYSRFERPRLTSAKESARDIYRDNVGCVLVSGWNKRIGYTPWPRGWPPEMITGRYAPAMVVELPFFRTLSLITMCIVFVALRSGRWSRHLR